MKTRACSDVLGGTSGLRTRSIWSAIEQNGAMRSISIMVGVARPARRRLAARWLRAARSLSGIACSPTAWPFPVVRIEHDRYRTVVDQGHMHVRAEPPHCDRNAAGAQMLRETLDERLGQRRRRGIEK